MYSTVILDHDGRLKRESLSFVKRCGSGCSVQSGSSTTVKFESYNENYNTCGVRNTSTSELAKYAQQQRLTDCLETLETLGYGESGLLVTLAAVQLISGLEVAA